MLFISEIANKANADEINPVVAGEVKPSDPTV